MNEGIPKYSSRLRSILLRMIDVGLRLAIDLDVRLRRLQTSSYGHVCCVFPPHLKGICDSAIEKIKQLDEPLCEQILKSEMRINIGVKRQYFFPDIREFGIGAGSVAWKEDGVAARIVYSYYLQADLPRATLDRALVIANDIKARKLAMTWLSEHGFPAALREPFEQQLDVA